LITETGRSKDITRSAFNLFVWAQIELQAGIICASAPALRVFFRRYLGGGTSSKRTRDTNTIVTNQSNHITVKKDTSVTFEQDSSESTESLTTPIDKIPMEGKLTWSPIAADSRGGAVVAISRYSHEEDSFDMEDLGWKKAEKRYREGRQPERKVEGEGER
jgi:hypothetical protein